MGWNHLSILKLKRLHSWSLEMDKSFHCTLFWAYHYLSMLGLKLFHVSKIGPREKRMPGYAFATLQWKFCRFEKILTIACIRCSHFDNCWCRWWWKFYQNDIIIFSFAVSHLHHTTVWPIGVQPQRDIINILHLSHLYTNWLEIIICVQQY